MERKRGMKKALVALARKLLVVCYGVLKSGTPFDPAKTEARFPIVKAPEAPPQRPRGPGTRSYVLKKIAG